MTQYRITSTAGVEMGVYEGRNALTAIAAMHRDAGYESVGAAATALGKTVNQLVAELIVAEIGETYEILDEMTYDVLDTITATGSDGGMLHAAATYARRLMAQRRGSSVGVGVCVIQGDPPKQTLWGIWCGKQATGDRFRVRLA